MLIIRDNPESNLDISHDKRSRAISTCHVINIPHVCPFLYFFSLIGCGLVAAYAIRAAVYTGNTFRCILIIKE